MLATPKHLVDIYTKLAVHKLVQPETMWEAIEKLSHDNLRELWSVLWGGEEDEFCNLYSLKSSTFSKWLNERRGSPNTEKIIKDLIYTHFGVTKPAQVLKRPFFTVSSFINFLKEGFPEKLKYIVFVDGDNCSYSMSLALVKS